MGKKEHPGLQDRQDVYTEEGMDVWEKKITGQARCVCRERDGCVGKKKKQKKKHPGLQDRRDVCTEEGMDVWANRNTPVYRTDNYT